MRRSFPITNYYNYYIANKRSINTTTTTTTTSKWSVIDKYQQRINSRQLLPDQQQLHVVSKLLQPKLDQLQQHYSQHHPGNYHHSRLNQHVHVHQRSLPGTGLLQRLRNHLQLNSTSSSANIKGLYLYGGVGTGKTMLMDLFHSAVEDDRKRRIHFHAFMLDLHARVHRAKMMHTAARGEDPLPAIIDQLASEAWLLCVDEFQVTDIADAMLLRRLLGGLIGKGMVLVTTSNRHPDELYKNGIQRQSFVPCIDLIKQHCDVYCLDAAGAGAVGNERPLRVDYRKLAAATAATALPTETSGKTTSSSSRFIYPLGPQTEQTIDGIFKALCRSELGGTTATSHLTTPTTTAAPTERILTVMGRPLRVPMQCGSTVARFTFQELCGQAMSAADYLELCANYQALILTGIPRMSVYANRNELRRFITLIDALYEHRVRLYCTADAAAAQLLLTDTTSTAVNAQPTASTRSDDIAAGEETYDEEFAFSRTVSRLTQMARGKWPSNFT